MKKKIIVRNLLLDQKKILLGQRTCGLWDLPGGRVENETVHEAGVREQLEETGMNLLGPSFLFHYIDYGRKLIMVLQWLKWEGQPQELDEDHKNWQWVPIGQWPENLSICAKQVLTSLP
jgi:8-oxo-dGTP pyrophosphatase MutT (NUDIX family)